MRQIKDAIPKGYVPKKMRENNGYLDARQKERQKWVPKYLTKSKNKYSPRSQRSQKEKGMAHEFIKTQKYSLAQS
jgi:hypothetical protein